MTREELKERFRQFSLRIIKMVDAMPKTISSNAIAQQIIRSGTSPAANYRAACLAKSDKDFINKLKIVEEEIDETTHWLSIIIDSGMLPKNRVQDLYDESLALGKITSKSIITAKAKVDMQMAK
ncbi:MAG: four helix bundle protein [Paludibacteraceae bacterium]|jgi:four helix bundle protein|nr:four helix bundle protein [Paludibacteraceae bacterium]